MAQTLVKKTTMKRLRRQQKMKPPDVTGVAFIHSPFRAISCTEGKKIRQVYRGPQCRVHTTGITVFAGLLSPQSVFPCCEHPDATTANESCQRKPKYPPAQRPPVPSSPNVSSLGVASVRKEKKEKKKKKNQVSVACAWGWKPLNLLSPTRSSPFFFEARSRFEVPHASKQTFSCIRLFNSLKPIERRPHFSHPSRASRNRFQR